MPFHWAKERGYLAQEGLDVETITFNSAQQMIAPEVQTRKCAAQRDPTREFAATSRQAAVFLLRAGHDQRFKST